MARNNQNIDPDDFDDDEGGNLDDDSNDSDNNLGDAPDDDDQDGNAGDADKDGSTDTGPKTLEDALKILKARDRQVKRANNQAKRLREKYEPQTVQNKNAKSAPGANQQQDDDAQAEVTKWQDRAIKQSAKSELISRGVDRDMVKLLLGQLKASEIEFDDDDEPDLEDWVDEMQDKFPTLFAGQSSSAPQRAQAGRTAAQRRTPPSVDQGAGQRSQRRALSPVEQMMRAAGMRG
jgi:hypothetical protein